MKKRSKKKSLRIFLFLLQYFNILEHQGIWSNLEKKSVRLVLEIKIKHESMAQQTLTGNISTLWSSVGTSCFLLHFLYKEEIIKWNKKFKNRSPVPTLNTEY